MDAVLQFFRIVLFAAVVVVLVIIGGFAGIMGADVIFGPKAAAVSNMTYPASDGSELRAYLNIPPGTQFHPGIIMAPDYWGLDEQILKLANLLAGEGYVVIAPDLYRGAASAVLPRALLLGFITPGERVISDLQSAYEYLVSLETVNSDAVGVIGLGFGGGAALRYAARNPRVSAVVDAYGPVLTSPDALGDLRGPVMGLFVRRDPLIRASQVDQFHALLDDAGIENDVTVYDTLSSGFFKFPDITVTGSETNLAWRDVVTFFDTHLK